jgi:Trypsin-co-occurring domain 1
MELQSKIISVELTDGTNVRVEATPIGDRKIGGFQTRPFNEVTTVIESLSKDIAETLQKTKPDKATVKFGIEIAIEGSKITAMLVKGISTANLEITLEWVNK